MQSLEDRIESKLQEIDKMFVVNPIEEKNRPLLNSGINQMTKTDQITEEVTYEQPVGKKYEPKYKPPKKPAQLTPY